MIGGRKLISSSGKLIALYRLAWCGSNKAVSLSLKCHCPGSVADTFQLCHANGCGFASHLCAMCFRYRDCCCNLLGLVGVALNVRFTTNGMCAKNNIHIYVAWTSNNIIDIVIMACDLYCCLLPQCEALHTCRSGSPIATLFAYFNSWDQFPLPFEKLSKLSFMVAFRG